ncbi:hypothetical protein G6L37_06930 [Agrobacterium rubi]|nr:hypothetical protein [Agrobacterium rubi]NTF25099.1 hypothetical protein [Agrobacterium rubi]
MTTSNLGTTADQNSHIYTTDPNGRIIRFQLGLDAPKGLPLLPGSLGGDSQILNVPVSSLIPKKHRGLKWDDFPVLKAPVFEDMSEFLAHSYETTRKFVHIPLAGDEVRDILSEQSAFVYDEATRQTHFSRKHIVERRAFVSKLHKKYAARKPLLVRYRGETEFREADPLSLANQSAGWHRYHHNYKLNFDAIGCKAIDHVISRYSSLPKPKPIVDGMPYRERMASEQLPNSQAGYFKYRNNFLTDPVGLQTMFALRTATEAEKSELFQFFSNWPNKGRGGPQMTFGGHVRRGVWTGSGKYDVGLKLQDEIGWAIHGGMPLGLVDLETDDKVDLTDAGHALLDIMHTDNYDPDAFLRFTDAETMTMPSSQIERIDSWMARFFGKMKTKVDRLT